MSYEPRVGCTVIEHHDLAKQLGAALATLSVRTTEYLEAIKANRELGDNIVDLQIDYSKACHERDECAANLLVCETAYQRCKDENCALHLALFHIENGCNHPDPEIRMLIQAASRAAAQRFTPNNDSPTTGS